MAARLDHLVVGAATLDEGVAWAEATLGVLPGPGGEHPLMGTHNRLLRVATVDYPRAYLELIAPQPGKQAQHGRRWFDLDDETVRDALRRHGPRLLHFVANVPDVRAACNALATAGYAHGEVAQASRETPRGLLQWQITVPADGHRYMAGLLPTLIEWGQVHPVSAMAESGVTLHAVTACHPLAPELRGAYEALALTGVQVKEGAANLCAVLDTPRGRVLLESKGL